MPKTLNPQNTFPLNIPGFPISGNNEPITIEPLENAVQAVLNRTENLHVRLSESETQGVKRVRTVASLAALSAATGFNNGDVCDVEGYGRYRLYNPSALTADGLWVLTATGGGRWVHTLRDMRGSSNGLATLDSSQRLAQDVRDASIQTQHIANQAVTAAKLAPGAAIANLGYTPLNKAGDTMTGNLNLTSAGMLGINLSDPNGAGATLIQFRTGGGVLQWGIGHQGVPGANNTGNDFSVWRYDNSGNYLDRPVLISRADGVLQARYNHQRRFTLEAHIGGTASVNITANNYSLLKTVVVYPPSGTILYLRRIRAYLGSSGLVVRIDTDTTVYTSTVGNGEAEVNVALSLVGNTSVVIRLSIYNVTAGTISALPNSSVWAEFEFV
jgi:hypothetical protein